MKKIFIKCPVCGRIMHRKRKGVYECRCGLVYMKGKDLITFNDISTNGGNK